MTVGSLFAGVGGFDRAFENAGFKTRWAVEIDDKARSVFARHFPDAQLFTDVRSVGAHNLEPVDVIVGGFPCQDLSVAGKRAGLDGARSGLFYELGRIVAELSPEWLCLENVPGLLSSNGGRDMGAVVGTLGELGYGLCWRVLDARHFGVPQRRRRVFIVGRAGGRCPVEVLFEPESVCGHPAPGDQAREGSATEAGGSLEERGHPALAKAVRTPTGGIDREDMHTLIAGTFQNTGHGYWNESAVGATVRTPDGSGSLEANIVAGPYWDGGDLSDTLDASVLAKGQTMPEKRRLAAVIESATAFDMQQVTSVLNRQRLEPGREAPTLHRAGGAHVIEPAIAFTERGREGGRNLEWQDEQSYALLNPGEGGRAQERNIATGMTVRRLTPVECERLQGFPDGWTAGQADSARYRQMGNAVAVPCVEWIARRLWKEAHR